MKTEIEIISDLLLQEFCECFNDALHQCQSPIERVLLTALSITMKDEFGFLILPGPKTLKFNELMESLNGGAFCYYIGGVYTQVCIDKYIVDFYFEAFDEITNKRIFRAAIECDGHEFHEKTKAQVARDKKRDRFFQSVGIYSLRFSGHEIWQNPLSCAEQIFNSFHAAARRLRGIEAAA